MNRVSLKERECLTLDGKLNSLRKPKSSPVASSLWSLVSEAVLTKLSVGHTPSQVGPRTDVQLAHSSFSNWKHTNKCVNVQAWKKTSQWPWAHWPLSRWCSVCVLEEPQRTAALWLRCSPAAVYLWTKTPGRVWRRHTWPLGITVTKNFHCCSYC